MTTALRFVELAAVFGLLMLWAVVSTRLPQRKPVTAGWPPPELPPWLAWGTHAYGHMEIDTEFDAEYVFTDAGWLPLQRWAPPQGDQFIAPIVWDDAALDRLLAAVLADPWGPPYPWTRQG